MSNYTKTTDFQAKDSLPTGNANKVVKGTEIDTEFNSIATAIATKANTASPTFTGTITAAAATFSGNVTFGDAATDTVTVTADVASNLIPSADSTYALGDSSNYWSNAYVDAVTTTGDVSVGGNLTVTGNATISGTLTFGDADTDSITLNAEIASDVIPDVDGTYDLGSATKEWQDLYIDGTANIDSLVADTADINSGTIDNTVIGGTTAVAGTFTTATATTGAITTVNSTTVNATTVDSTNVEVTNIKAKDGTASASIADATGVMTIASSVLTTADINGGSIDGTTVGATTASTGNFSTLSIGGTAITATAAELNALDGITATVTELNYTDGVTSNIQTQLDAKQASDADLTAIAGLANTDGNFIVGNGTTWVAESGDTAIASLGITATAAELNTLDGITATVTELNYTDGVTSAIQTQLDAKAPIDAATFTGTTTIPTADINGGTIDGTTIGGATPAAGTFSTFATTGAATLGAGTNLGFDSSATVSLDVGDRVDAIHVPSGTTAQRPTGANGYFRYNSDDGNFEGYANGAWGSVAGGANITIDSMTGDGVDTTLTLSVAPDTENNTSVYIDGVYQNKTTYSVSGTTLTFTTAPPSGSLVEASVVSTATLDTPADGSVTPSKIGSGDFVFPNDVDVDGVFTVTDAGSTFATRADGGGFSYTQGLDAATAGCTFTGASDRGDLASISLWQTTTGADGGYIALRTSPSGSTTPAERMRIDSSGNVGIGTSSPKNPSGYGSTYEFLTVAATTGGADRGAFLELVGTGTGTTGYWVGGVNYYTAGNTYAHADIQCVTDSGANTGKLQFITNADASAGFGTVAMQIDSSGIVTINSGYIGEGDTMLLFASSVDAIVPRGTGGAGRDNAIDLGNATNRFNDIYASNGTIQTSDEREKQDVEELSQAEQNVAVAAKALLRKYRWKDAVAEKGDDARIHFGIIAQDLKAAFEAEGLDAGRYAMFINSEWWETYTDVPAVEAQDAVLDEEGNVVTEAVEAKEAYTRTDTYYTEEEAPEDAVKKDRMGVRYSELLAFIIADI